MSINLDKIDFHDFNSLFKQSEPKSIDIYINSFYSFLFLKNSTFYSTLKSISEKNYSCIRILSMCSKDQFDSICSYFSSIKNICFNNIPCFTEKPENFITIYINKKIIFFFKITYEETKKAFNCTLYNILFNELITFFLLIYDFLWKTIEKNEVLEERTIFQQDFIDIATHQLRNPILPILGFSKTLKSKIKDPVLLEYVDIIIRNGEKLRDIANDILDVSRIETNSLKTNKESFDISMMISNIIAEYQNISLRESTDIKFIYYGKLNLSINADKSFISQALYNLLNNSYFFTKSNQGQEISISLDLENNSHVTITVEDEGPGMDEKDLDHLFTKFFTKNSGGTGLGLYISKKLIELHGGSIDVKNRSPDLGLKFVVKIPISTTNDLFNQYVENKPEITRILFIDSFSENLNLVKNKIQNFGYRVDYYTDPLDAMEHFIPGKYVFIFLGIDIGGIDGFDLYDELKKRDNNIKGYFMTSNKINLDAMEEIFSKDMMTSNFLHKPVSMDAVLKIIKENE
jgi:two-component system, OmpR family, aerobic respiration control sensor histidine kinase ArcB